MNGPTRSGRYSDRSSDNSAAAAVGSASAALSAPENLTRTSGETSRQASAERGACASPKSRVSDQQLERLRRSLSPRDLAVIRSISTYRFLSSAQLRGFHFYDHATASAASRVCSRVLGRLRASELIEPIGRRVGGLRAGSEAIIWRIGKLGDRLLRLEQGHGARARRKEPSQRFLQHCLDIAQAHLQLLTADRSGQLQLLQVEAEPTTWRDYLGPGGEHLVIKPDLLALTAVDAYEDSWALEVDEGTESIPTLLAKCAQYEAYRATGQEQQQRGVFPIVIWIVPTKHRARRLSDALTRAPRLDPSLYRICTPDQLVSVVCAGAA